MIRVNKTADYTVMSNTHFKEKGLSLKAKGLLSLMLSLPDNWDYSIAGLCAICVEKESAIKSTLDELKRFGYLRINKLYPAETKSGRIEYVYDIYETPQQSEKQAVEKQEVENQPLEIQGVENPRQYNTNKSNTNILSTNKSNTKDIKESKRKASGSFDRLIGDYAKGDAELVELLLEWLKVRKAKRAAMTDKAIQLNLEKLDALALESGMTVADYLKEVICRGWQAFYPIKTYSKPAHKQSSGIMDDYESMRADIEGGLFDC